MEVIFFRFLAFVNLMACESKKRLNALNGAKSSTCRKEKQKIMISVQWNDSYERESDTAYQQS